MQLTAKNEMTSKEDQFQLSLLAAMGNTQRKEAADPLASKLNKVAHESSAPSVHSEFIEFYQWWIFTSCLFKNMHRTIAHIAFNGWWLLNIWGGAEKLQGRRFKSRLKTKVEIEHLRDGWMDNNTIVLLGSVLGNPADWLLRPCICGSLRSRQPV